MTRRWPGLQLRCSRCAVARAATTPICARRRASSGGAVTCAASGSTPAGSAASARGRESAPVHRRRLVGGGVEVVAERGAQRRLVAGRDLDAVEHRRQPLSPPGVSSLRERLRLGLELAGSWLGARGGGSGVGLAVRAASAARTASARRRASAEAARSRGHQPLRRLARPPAAWRRRRAPTISRVCGFERVSWRVELGDLLAALARLRLQALARARARRPSVVSALERSSAAASAASALVVRRQRGLLEVVGAACARWRARRLRRRGAPASSLGLGDQRLLARDVAPSCSTRARARVCAVGGARALALEVLLLDAEALQHGAGAGRLLLAQAAAARSAASASARAALARPPCARPTFASAAARRGLLGVDLRPAAPSSAGAGRRASSLRISAEISL